MRLTNLSGARFTRRSYFPSLLILSGLFGCLAAQAGESRPIDTAKSTMTVHVSKAGALSMFGHDHEIAAPIAGGSVDTTGRHVELRVDAAALRVRDPKASEKDRTEIQKTMLGPDVLDAERHREILFKSTAVEKAGDGWTVRGNLTLHGETKPVTIAVREAQEGRYAGSARLRQTEFGIKPVKAAGGTVRVKDELRIDFEIQLAR
jgi:polyisoprenoid-binding protein YceI